MTYRSAIDYVNGFIDFERLPEPRLKTSAEDIERFRGLLQSLGSPHLQYPTLHIVGTKGKGSTAAILASILTTAGYKVGLYTSPHLLTVRERIQVDGKPVGRGDFAGCIERIRRQYSECDAAHALAFRTVFEHLTAAGFLYFADRKVNIAVVEAGLGAKLDATIVIEPILSIITPIALDHTQVLGGTVREIASDKACAIKANIPVVSARQPEDVAREIERRAAEMNSRLFYAEGADRFEVLSASLKGTRFNLKDRPDNTSLFLPLAGRFQLDNLSVVLMALGVLERLGFKVEAGDIRRGVRRTRWPGRLQSLPGEPPILLDGAHNTLAAVTLVRSLLEIAPDRRWRIVYSSILGKPAAEMLKALALIARRFYLARLQFPKGLKEEALRAAAEEAGVAAEFCRNVPASIIAAKAACRENEGVLITGSLYLVAEALRWWRGFPAPPADGRIDSAR